jgi:hypothetical protein
MNTYVPVLLALFSLSIPVSNAIAVSDQEPPAARLVFDDFSPTRQMWQPTSGRWTVSNGTYGDNLAGPADIATIVEYRNIDPAAPPDSQLQQDNYVLRARVLNRGSDDTDRAGVVYGYQDSQNYYEATVSATGGVRVRTVINGIAHDDVPSVDGAAALGAVANTWFEIEIHRNNGTTRVRVNGARFFGPITQSEFGAGQVGLVTQGVLARFDNVSVDVPIGDQEFFESFSGAPFVAFTPQSGQWAVTNGAYSNTSVQQTSISLAPIRSGVNVPNQLETIAYTFHARMLNPYGAAGNLIGIVFNYEGSYTEVVFSPTGIARLNRFENGAVRTIAQTTYNGRPNVPFEVTLENSPSHFAVRVDGQNLFPNVAALDVNPRQFAEGGVGLITHWAPGRFDNVSFDHGAFQACSFTFDNPPPQSWIVSGAWNTNGGTLNATSAGSSDIVDFDCRGDRIGDDAGSYQRYHARLLNEYGNSGNLVGLVYNYQDPSNYFEVVFSSTGIAQLNKIIQGVRYPVRTKSHTIPRNTFFDVDVIRRGITTTVNVNGVQLFIPESQGDLRGGSIGVITHWSRGRFDNVSLVEYKLPDPLL